MFRKFLKPSISVAGLFDAATAMACVGTVIGYLGFLWWPLGLARNFPVQCGLFLACAVAINAIAKRRNQALVALVFLIPNVIAVAPYYLHMRPVHAGPPAMKALLSNVYSQNTDYDEVLKFIRKTDADFVVLQEVTWNWSRRLAVLDSMYPHSIYKTREDNFGIAFLSKTKPLLSEIIITNRIRVPMIRAELQTPHGRLTLIGAHPPPPLFRGYIRAREAAFDEIVAMAGTLKGPIMVLGDLNATPWSRLFRRLVTESRLRDARCGFGLLPTWPVQMPLLYIPLDHCLVSPEIRVRSMKTGPNLGSDHLPVIVEFGVSRNNRTARCR